MTTIPGTSNKPVGENNTELYAPNILIVGDSGSGKSTSYEGLPQDGRTAIIEAERKALPFKHSFQKITYVEDFAGFNAAMAKYQKDPEVRYIVIDSISKHLERCLQYCRSSYKNYDIWTNYGSMGGQLMQALHSKTKVIIAISLADLIEQDSNATGSVTTTYKRMAAHHAGNELKGKIDKEFTIVVHTQLDRNKDTGLVSFNFRVKPDGLTTAKTPRAMFAEAKNGLIPNDVTLILKELARLGTEYEQYAKIS